MTENTDIKPISGDDIRNMVLVALFNLLPLLFVFLGSWTSFDVVAFYWMEVVAAGLFALIKGSILAFHALVIRNLREFFRHIATLVFMPLHFGFFIVMTCFLVGSFLPETTEPVPLTDPLVPFFMVIKHVNFVQVFPIVMAWEVILFLLERMRIAHDPLLKPKGAITEAYARLGILFVSAFIGLFVSMQMDDRMWGAITLVAVKTIIAVLAHYISLFPSVPDSDKKETSASE